MRIDENLIYFQAQGKVFATGSMIEILTKKVQIYPYFP